MFQPQDTDIQCRLFEELQDYFTDKLGLAPADALRHTRSFMREHWHRPGRTKIIQEVDKRTGDVSYHYEDGTPC